MIEGVLMCVFCLDYKQLSSRKNLSAGDRKTVDKQLKLLPDRTKVAQTIETGEVMEKMKEVRLFSF